MQFRVLIAACGALACAACANDRSPQVLGYNARPPAAPQQTAALAAEPQHPPHMKKTMASKVLAAIALEHVTGRKPDPSRLAELN